MEADIGIGGEGEVRGGWSGVGWVYRSGRVGGQLLMVELAMHIPTAGGVTAGMTQETAEYRNRRVFR